MSEEPNVKEYDALDKEKVKMAQFLLTDIHPLEKTTRIWEAFPWLFGWMGWIHTTCYKEAENEKAKEQLITQNLFDGLSEKLG